MGIEAGRQTWAYGSDDTVANAWAYFDLTACAACVPGAHCPAAFGSKGAAVVRQFAENLGVPVGGTNPVCRAGITLTATAAAQTVHWSCAASDGVKTSIGDGATPECTLWQGDLVNADHPLTPVITTTATATQNGDALVFSGVDNTNGPAGSFVLSRIGPPYTNASLTWRIAGLDDGTANNLISIYSPSTGKITSATTTGGSAVENIGAVGTAIDGTLHTFSHQWNVNLFRNFLDGVQDGSSDTSGAVPTNYTHITIGTDRAGVVQTGDLLPEWCVWQTPGHPYCPR
jgi:hypothetical protein